LELTFDHTDANWTEHKFQYTAAHEMGHLLGLDHIAAKKSLMNDYMHEDFRTPQKADIAAIVKIWT